MLTAKTNGPRMTSSLTMTTPIPKMTTCMIPPIGGNAMKHKGGEVGGLSSCTIFSTLERTPVISSLPSFIQFSCMAPVLSSRLLPPTGGCVCRIGNHLPCSMADCAMNWQIPAHARGQRGGFVDYFHRAYDGLGDGVYMLRQKNSTRQRAISIMSGNLSSFRLNSWLAP